MSSFFCICSERKAEENNVWKESIKMRKNSKLIDSFLFSLKCKVPYQARVVSRSSRIRTGGYRVCGRSARPCTRTWLCARRVCRSSQTHRLLFSHLQMNIGIKLARKQLPLHCSCSCSYTFSKKSWKSDSDKILKNKKLTFLPTFISSFRSHFSSSFWGT